MKCERCNKRAVFHITDILGPAQLKELHLCEECAARYLSEPIPGTQLASSSGTSAEIELLQQWEQLHCPECGATFEDFRNTGRLGCPHDYEFFQEQLRQLLESIHGEIRHLGKVPSRLATPERRRLELARLRRQMQELINAERYEEAARLRDQIRQLEARMQS